jgi:hypothetical protein
MNGNVILCNIPIMTLFSPFSSKAGKKKKKKTTKKQQTNKQ